MDFLIFAIMLMVLLFIVVRIKRQKHQRYKQEVVKPVRGDELAVWPFAPMPIMTDSEVIFFKKLQKAMPDYLIFGQVQLSRIIDASEEAGSDKGFWFNRICRQSVDYVLIDQDAQTTLLAIELDDWTHDNEKRSKADAKKDKALASAGIPILRFHAEKLPSVEILQHDIEAVLLKYPQK